jgi:hypothetical protein
MGDVDFKKLSNTELYKLRDGFQGWHENSAGAKAELERRKAFTEFWTKNVVSWLALIVAIASLIISIIK